MKRTFDYVKSTRTDLPVRGASVTIYIQGTSTKATIYGANNTGSAPIANPIVTDADGSFAFYVPDGSYSLAVAYPGSETVTVTDVEIYDLDDLTVAISGLTPFFIQPTPPETTRPQYLWLETNGSNRARLFIEDGS